MLIKDVKLSYNDIAIVPSPISEIRHRSECNVFYENGKMPIFTAPMSTIVSIDNFDLFEQNYINAILPRNIDLNTRLDFSKHGKWSAYSLNEFQEIFTHRKGFEDVNDIKVLIDVANGHMEGVYDAVKHSKNVLKDKITIMIGNIANPKTYKEVCDCGADYVRLGIGGGSGCITSSNTGIHYPMASLIEETYQEKVKYSQYESIPFENLPKIIADGGIRNFSDVNKALALGADYVMIGGVFASCLESAGETFFKNNLDYTKTIINQYDGYKCEHGKIINKNNEVIPPVLKVFYGMASRQGQRDISGASTKTAEGIERIVEVKYSISSWVSNMISYLTSAMSYTDIKDVKDFNPFTVTTIQISPTSYSSINK